jgi:hypothetical protein
MLKKLTRLRLMAVSVVASGLVLQACDDPPETVVATEAPAKQPAPDPLQSITPEPALTRQAMLAAVAEAASDYAAGAAPTGTDPLVRRTFDISLPFGCSGGEALPAEDTGDGLARWSWSEDRKTLRLSLNPADWTGSDLISDSADPAPWEAVEGVWISRPWMMSEGCPLSRTGSPVGGPASSSPETVGLAAVFEEGGSRLGRRNGRAYTHIVRPEDDQAVVAPLQGYRLRLQGRVTAFPDGRAIHCRANGVRQRPVCVAAV